MTAIGHNSGDAATMIRDDLDERTRDLAATIARLTADPAPDTITDHAAATAATARLGALKHAADRVAEAHAAAKAPHLAAGRACDAWKADSLAKLAPLQTALKTAVGDYQAAIAEQERQRREAEAEAAREFAERTGNARHATMADAAEAHAAKPVADMSRVRARTGAMASLRPVVDFEIEDAALIPREFLVVNEAAVRAAVRAGTPIPGVRRIERPVVAVRA